MKEIIFSERIKVVAPNLKVLQIEADVDNSLTPDDLWKEIEKSAEELKDKFALQELNKRPSIAATRKAYKNGGKDPNRYRPSAEALGRRIINGKGIYRLTTLIDIINQISIITGYSIGGFDADKINGDILLLDIGTDNDKFEAIGRGTLNIEGLPVYRDKSGGIGTPTSDEERTKLTLDTHHLLMIVNIYGEEMETKEVEEMTRNLLSRYASLKNFESIVYENFQPVN